MKLRLISPGSEPTWRFQWGCATQPSLNTLVPEAPYHVEENLTYPISLNFIPLHRAPKAKLLRSDSRLYEL